jgi:spore germination protein KB
MKNAINVRQICFILIAYSASLKLLLYPTQMSYICGNALLFPAIVNIVLQTAAIWGVCYLSSKANCTFFELIERRCGGVIARIIYALFALFFIVNAIIPMTEQQLFVHAVFYDTIPSILVFLPFFFFSIYAGAKTFKNAGRVADIAFPIFLITLGCIFIMSINECQFSALLPILKVPFKDVANGSIASIFRFSDSAFLIMFTGNFSYKKGDAAKITLSYLLGSAILLLFMAMFYAVFAQLSPTQAFAIEKIPIFFTAINLVGKIDLFALYALDLVMLFALVLNVQMGCYCLTKVFNCDLSWAYSLGVNAILIALSLIFNNHFFALNQFFCRWMWIATLLFAYVLPLGGWLLLRRDK